MLDYFYGLKETHRIDSFAQFFHDVGFDVYLKAIYRLITDYLSDGHSSWHDFSYLSGPIDYKAKDSSILKVGEHYSRQTKARTKCYPDGIPGYEEVGNTAYITFDTFTKLLQPNDYYEMDPKDYPEGDTIGLIIKAHQQITRENSPIENVVLDLSANLDGADNVSAFVVPWFLGEASPGMVDKTTGAMCTTTYRSDVNLDHGIHDVLVQHRHTVPGGREGHGLYARVVARPAGPPMPPHLDLGPDHTHGQVPERDRRRPTPLWED